MHLSCIIPQDLRTTASPTFAELTITKPTQNWKFSSRNIETLTLKPDTLTDQNSNFEHMPSTSSLDYDCLNHIFSGTSAGNGTSLTGNYYLMQIGYGGSAIEADRLFALTCVNSGYSALPFAIRNDGEIRVESNSHTNQLLLETDGNIRMETGGLTLPYSGAILNIPDGRITVNNTSLPAIFGTSYSNAGVQGSTSTGSGVLGVSGGAGKGVYGSSDSGYSGYFENGLGVWCNKNITIDADSTAGKLILGLSQDASIGWDASGFLDITSTLTKFSGDIELAREERIQWGASPSITSNAIGNYLYVTADNTEFSGTVRLTDDKKLYIGGGVAATLEWISASNYLDVQSADTRFSGTISTDEIIPQSGILTVTGGISLGDNKVLTFGDGPDASISWTSASSFLSIVSADTRFSHLIDIPTTAATAGVPTAGVITQNTVPVFHTFGTRNIFIGANAGNFSATLESGATDNVCLGSSAGKDLTTGDRNFFLGANAGSRNQGGLNNVAIGSSALNANVVRSGNVAIGTSCMLLNTSGADTVAIGLNVMSQAIMAGKSVGIGSNALRSMNSQGSVSVGYKSGYSLGTGARNIFLGANAGYNQTTNSDLLIIDRGLSTYVQRASAAAEATDAIIYGIMDNVPANQDLYFNAGINLRIRTITVSDDIDTGDHTVLVDCSGGAVTATLPTTPKTGKIYNIKCIDDTNTCTIGRNGKNIDGDASDLILINKEVVTLHYDGTGWQII